MDNKDNAEAADNDIKRCPDGYEEVKKKKSCQEACCMLEIPFNQNEEFKDSKPDFKNDRNCFIRKNKCSQKKMHGSKILCILGIIMFFESRMLFLSYSFHSCLNK